MRLRRPHRPIWTLIWKVLAGALAVYLMWTGAPGRDVFNQLFPGDDLTDHDIVRWALFAVGIAIIGAIVVLSWKPGLVLKPPRAIRPYAPRPPLATIVVSGGRRATPYPQLGVTLELANVIIENPSSNQVSLDFSLVGSEEQAVEPMSLADVQATFPALDVKAVVDDGGDFLSNPMNVRARRAARGTLLFFIHDTRLAMMDGEGGVLERIDARLMRLRVTDNVTRTTESPLLADVLADGFDLYEPFDPMAVPS